MITSHALFSFKLTPLGTDSQKRDATETSSQFQHYLAYKKYQRDLGRTVLGRASIFNFILCKVLLRMRKLEPLIK